MSGQGHSVTLCFPLFDVMCLPTVLDNEIHRVEMRLASTSAPVAADVRPDIEAYLRQLRSCLSVVTGHLLGPRQ